MLGSPPSPSVAYANKRRKVHREISNPPKLHHSKHRIGVINRISTMLPVYKFAIFIGQIAGLVPPSTLNRRRKSSYWVYDACLNGLLCVMVADFLRNVFPGIISIPDDENVIVLAAVHGFIF